MNYEQCKVFSPGMAAQCAKIIELQIYFVPPTIYGRLSLTEQYGLILRHSWGILPLSEAILEEKNSFFSENVRRGGSSAFKKTIVWFMQVFEGSN